MKQEEELKNKLEKIKKVFDIKKVLEIKPNKEYIKKYYLINKIPYSIFHTKSDLIHMGISRNGKYKEKDLLEHVRIMEKYINHNTKNVLELATGRGANSLHLAKKFPMINFYGIDISNGQLDIAYKKAKEVKNYFPSFGDYHNLNQFKSNTFNIIFIIEALCHSEHKEKVLKEVFRVLKKSGIFVIFDGYYKKSKNLNSSQKLAQKLVAKGMALNGFENYSEFKGKIKKFNFKIIGEEDVSHFIIPTLNRFEKIAGKFLRYPKISKHILKIFPKEFSYNIISGYLMSYLVKNKLAYYKITILRKQ